jgi:hypothetical protein
MRKAVEWRPLFLNKHSDREARNIDLAACIAKKKAERMNLPFADNKLQSQSLFH